MRPIHPAIKEDLKKFNQSSIKWLIGRIKYLQENQTIPGAMNAANYKNSSLFLIGEMFLYHYDPKWKHKLPYYDRFPLVIPVKLYDDGFLGLNLHYLPPQMRMAFLNKLLTLAMTPPGDVRTRIKVTYELLKENKNFVQHIPCLKRYLTSHVQGRMLKIWPHEWAMAAYLPIADWRKTNDVPGLAKNVYRESIKMINRNKG